MDNSVHAFLTSKGLGSTEVYIGYDVDTTVPNYQLRTLSGQVQSYENFYSHNMNSATWHCVSMFVSYWYPEECDQNYHFLCSNLSNILAPPTTTTTQTTTDYSSTTESTTASQSTSSQSTSTTVSQSISLQSTSTTFPSTSSQSTSTTTSPSTSSQSTSTTSPSTSSQSTSTTASPSTTSQSTSTTSPSTSSQSTSTFPSTSSQSTSTTTSPSTTTPSQGCACPTNCVPVSNTVTINSTEELNAKIAELKKEIEVEKSTLSSNIRKKTSADDPRPSAKTFGFIGIIIISVVLGGIVALDLPRLVIGIKEFKANMSKFFKKI